MGCTLLNINHTSPISSRPISSIKNYKQHIDYGVSDEFDEEENEDTGEKTITIYGDPKSFAQIQSYLEQNGFEITQADFTYVPNDLKEVTDEQRETIDKMVERLEEFDDVQSVYTNMK